LDGCTEYRWPLLFCPGSSFRSRISLGDGTGNGPMISLRPSLITAHHSVSSLSDPAREASPCSRYLRPARDVDTTCTVGRNVHESMATIVRAHRAPNLLRGCFGRSDRRAQRQGESSRPSGLKVSHGGQWATSPLHADVVPEISGRRVAQCAAANGLASMDSSIMRNWKSSRPRSGASAGS